MNNEGSVAKSINGSFHPLHFDVENFNVNYDPTENTIYKLDDNLVDIERINLKFGNLHHSYKSLKSNGQSIYKDGRILSMDLDWTAKNQYMTMLHDWVRPALKVRSVYDSTTPPKMLYDLKDYKGSSASPPLVRVFSNENYVVFTSSGKLYA